MTDTKNTVSDERLAVFLQHAMKPDEIAGPKSAERVNELLGWFKRYLEGHANPKWLVAHAAELAYALQSLRVSIPGGVGVQCCMCGKTGLSTIEGDGGTECQLEDGRWTCSEPCWEKAGGYGPDLSPAAGEPVAYLRDLQPDAEDEALAVCWSSDPGAFPVYAAPSNPVISDEWPEPPEGWQRTKPAYARKDGALRVEFVHGREGTPWCVSMSLGNGACATLSYHATTQEALTTALSVKPQSDI